MLLNTCKILAEYDAFWMIQETFLNYCRAIRYSTSKYANGTYKSSASHGQGATFLNVAVGCKCAFPVAGEPTERSITFERDFGILQRLSM